MQYKRFVPLEEIHWITEDPFRSDSLGLLRVINTGKDSEAEVCFKIRHTPDFTPGVLLKDENGWILKSEKDVQGVAPGQFATIYTKDCKICLGSSMIRKY